MAIFGKVLGGVLGFQIGGPLGALVGAVVGHQFDRFRNREREILREGGPRPAGGPGREAASAEEAGMVFAVGVTALAAKVAKADGRVTADEIRAFRGIFGFPEEEEKQVARIYNEAKRSAGGFEPYAEQVAAAFRSRPDLLAGVVDALFAVAAADGTLHPREDAMIARVAGIFGLSERELAGLRARHARAAGPEGGLAAAYATLGVAPDISDGELRRAHRDLVRRHHPDRLMAQGHPEEFIAVANDRLAAINAAYDAVRKARGR